MNLDNVSIERTDLRKLLAAANGDAALVYLFLQSGGDVLGAEQALQMSTQRAGSAMAVLRQLGLWQEQKHAAIEGEPPKYTERDVMQAMDTDASFQSLYGEIQRRLGRTLSTEELKILLSMVRYLGLPGEVVCMLVSFCQERARQKGNLRNPSLRIIEKEAYAWAEQGIDTMEQAAAYIQRQNQRRTRLHRLTELLQIRGRSLTPAEEKYAGSWLELPMEEAMIKLAYEKTCLNTGGLSWPYMNKILMRWKEAGYRTVRDVQENDAKAASRNQKRSMDDDEQAAIRRMLQED